MIGAGRGVLYANGAQAGANPSMSLRPVDLGSTAYNYFGRSQFASAPYMDGSFHDIRVYDRALPAAEILALASGQPCAGRARRRARLQALHHRRRAPVVAITCRRTS